MRTVEDKLIAVRLDFATSLSSSFCSCHLFGAAYQVGSISAENSAEMTVEQMKKIVSFVMCTISFGQNIYKMMFDVNVSNLYLRIKIESVKEPIQSNSVGS